ncbi:MAG: hypothetical protein ACYDGR_01750 [Candidatus Dormibacteria bacterium]
MSLSRWRPSALPWLVTAPLFIAAFWPAGANASPAPLKVDRQAYVSATPVNPYQSQTNVIHVGQFLGTPETRSFVHVDLSVIASRQAPDSLTLVLVPNSDATNQSAQFAKLLACPLTEELPATFNSAQPPGYDCSKVAVPASRLTDGSWKFELAALARGWFATGNKGAAIVADPAAGTGSFDMAFDTTKSVAGYSYAGGLQEAPPSSSKVPAPVAPPPIAAPVPLPPFVPSATVAAPIVGEATEAPSQAPASGPTPVTVRPSVPAGRPPVPIWLWIVAGAMVAGATIAGTGYAMWTYGPVLAAQFGRQWVGSTRIREVIAVLCVGALIGISGAVASTATPGGPGGNAIVGLAPLPGGTAAGGGRSPSTGPSGSGSTANPGQARGAGSGPAGSSSGSPAGSGSQAVAPIQEDTGITSRTITIGVLLSGGNPGAAFGVHPPNQSDPNAANSGQPLAQALIDEINSHGGLGGRQIIPVYQVEDNTDNSQSSKSSQENNLCVAFTDQSKVALVLSLNNDGFQFGYPCLIQHGTPLIDNDNTFRDAATIDGAYPYLILPHNADITRVARLMPAAFQEEGFITQHMGVIAYDTPGIRNIVQNTLVPGLEARGGKVGADIVYSSIDYQDAGSQTAAAVVKFRGDGVDRVVFFAPGGGVPLLFTKQADSQGYYPRLGISTLDCPSACLTPGGPTALPAASVKGAVGLGYSKWRDTNGYDPHANPTSLMNACWTTVNRRTGSTYPQGDYLTADYSLRVCEQFAFIAQTLAPAVGRTLLRSQIGQYAALLGGSFQSMYVPSTHFAAGHLDGVNAYSLLAWNQDCDHKGNGCFNYTSGYREMP